MNKNLLFIFFLVFLSQRIFSQCGGTGTSLTVQNPSFEGPSQAHVVPGPWNACYGSPDTQPGQWGFTQAPSNGTSYISALQGGNCDYPCGYSEGASQQLSSCMVAGTTYTFSLDLAFSTVYNTAEPGNCYGSLQIMGGSAMCGQNEILWQSGVITNTAWQTYTITLTPTQNWCYISMRPYFITSCSGYINIMIDNLGPIVSPGPGLNATVNSDISCSNTILGDISCPADSIILTGLFNNSPTPATLLTDSTWTENVVYPPGSAGTQDIYITAYTQNGDTLNDTITFNLVEITPAFTTANVCAGTPVLFTNATAITSGNIVNYQWNFGDGAGTSSQQNPSYSYASPGTYSVQLIVTSDLGCTDSITQTVQVFDVPLANFSVANACLGIPSSFSNQSSIASGSLVSASWDFGDGSGTSAAASPSYTYLSDGTYNVSLIVTSNNGCTDTVIKTTIIHPLPVANFTANNVCDDDSVNFSNTSTISSGSIVASSWNFGDLSTSSLMNPSHLYANPGTFTVTLSSFSDSGCNTLISKNIVVNPLPVANFTTSNVCLDNIANFNSTSTISSGSITSYFWDFGDSNNSSSQNSSHQYSNSGNYSVLLIVVSDSSCSDTIAKPIEIYYEPTAAFSVNNVCKYDSAKFTDNSTIANGNISSFIWNFGDGANSNSQNSSHLYNSAGTYNIIFAVASDNGCVDSSTQTITIFPVPVALFTTNDVCQYTTAQFTDGSNISSGAINSYQWDFDDGTNSASQNPSHNFSPDGVYNVELLVTSDNGCKDSITQSITIFPVPVADFSFVNDICVYTAAQFSDLTTVNFPDNISSWSWDFGDLNNSGSQSPSNFYSNDGTFTVQLIVNSNNNCSDTVSKQITVRPVPVADFSFQDQNDCVTDTADFIDLSNVSSGTISNWNWDFGDVSFSSQQSPSHLYSAAGTYQVTLIASSDFGCLDTITKTTIQFPIPTADFTADSVCLNDITTFTDLSSGNGDLINKWTWIFGDNSLPNNTQNPTHLYTPDGDYYVILLVETSNGCEDYDTLSVTVFPLPVANFASTEVCLNEPPTSFDGTSSSVAPGLITSFNWDFGDNNSGTGVNTTHVYQNAGIFNVELIVTTEKGCVDDTVISVKVKELPILVFYAPKTADCDYPFCAQFNGTPVAPANTTIISKIWDFGDGGIDTGSFPVHCFSPAGDYDVKFSATTSEFCTKDSILSNYITVYPVPVAGFNYSPVETTILNSQIDFTDNSVGSTGWHWDFGDLDTSEFQNPVHEYADTGTYTIMQIVDNGLCADTITHTVIIKPDFIVYIPNAFTPDDDGINDVFLPKGSGFKNENYSLYIFDRWGDLIYETHEANGFWDGKVNGKLSKEDVYVYELRVEDFFDKSHRFTGHVTLLRK